MRQPKRTIFLAFQAPADNSQKEHSGPRHTGEKESALTLK